MSSERTATASTATRAGLASDWLIARTRRLNLLLTGSHMTTQVLLASLRPYLQTPLCEWAFGTALPAPGEVSTLLICDVAILSLEQQQALLSCLENTAPGQTQVVSTTALELFTLVEHGMFLAALFYRLNTVRLDAPHASFSPCASH